MISAAVGLFAAIGSLVGGLPWVVVGLLAIAGFVLALGAVAGVLAVWDRIRPLARVHLAEDEIGRIIDEGQSLKDHPFEGRKAAFYQCANWWDSAATFIEAVFGKPERDRFMRRPETGEVLPLKDGYDDHIEARCNHLRDLAERLGGKPESVNKIRVSRRKVIALGKEQQEAAGKSPFSDVQEVAVPALGEETDAEPTDTPDEEVQPPSETREPRPVPVESQPEPEPDEDEEDQERRPVLRPGMGTLEKLYIEGKKMQRAASPFAAVTGFFHGSPPTDAQIDRWQGRVRAELSPGHRRRFRFAPLDARVNEGMSPLAGLGLSLESEQAKRLRVSLEELTRIMDELDGEGYW